MSGPMSQAKSVTTGLKGLVFLDSKNAILYEQLQPILFEGKREACEVNFCDFDDFSYKLAVGAAAPNIVRVNVAFKAANDFKKHGSTELLAKIFPGLEKSPDAGFNVCLEFDADKYANNTVFLTNIADLKRHLLGGPLVQAFDTLVSGATPGPVTSFQFRTSEILYICPSAAKDKVTVIFLIDFNEGIDKAISKVFLQEFVEGQRAIRTAPPVSYTKEPPLELSSLKLAPTPTKSGYIAFSLEKRHVEGAKKDQAVTLLTGFRSYLLYHIKCTKTYLQMRMRKRVAGWLQVLNRAVPEVETEKKTAAGKTFTRKSVI